MLPSLAITDRFRVSSSVHATSNRLCAKLFLTMAGVALLATLVIGAVMYRAAANRDLEQANRQLASVRSMKADEIQNYFATARQNVTTLCEDGLVIDAMRGFPDAMKATRDEARMQPAESEQVDQLLLEYYSNVYAAEYKRRTGVEPPVMGQFESVGADTRFLQYLYLASNPRPSYITGDAGSAQLETTYSNLHRNYHPAIRNFVQQLGCDDVYLCDLNSGEIVYSVDKAVDFATSLKVGPYADSNLGRVFRQAADVGKKGDVFFANYEPYLPYFEKPAGFIASPVFDGDTKIGVALVPLPITHIDEILARQNAMGATSEVYAAGKLSSPSTSSVRRENGLIVDEHGAMTLAATKLITIDPGIAGVSDPIQWRLTSTLDCAQLGPPVDVFQILRNAGVLVLPCLVFPLVCAAFFTRVVQRHVRSSSDATAGIRKGSISVPAEIDIDDELVRELQDVADGDLTVTLNTRDETTGLITGSVNSMIAQLRSLVKHVKLATNQVNESAMDVRDISNTLSQDSVRQSNRIATTSNQIREITESIQSVAMKTRESADVAQRARQSVSEGLRAVSDTVDGMQRIRNQVQETSKRIKRLGESSQEIGEIVQLIADIADRTSILALNASIQAAMAGEAGQGFAVVAEEVERLADRSNDATKQIATLIKAIQTETRDAIIDMEDSKREVVEGTQLASLAGATLTEIDDVSAQLAELINDVSSETDVQTGVARKIAATMGEIAETTYVNADQSRQAAVQIGRLAEFATHLRDSVSRFRVDDASQCDASHLAIPHSEPRPTAAIAPSPSGETTPGAMENVHWHLATTTNRVDPTVETTETDENSNALMDHAQHPLIKGAHGFPTKPSQRLSV